MDIKFKINIGDLDEFKRKKQKNKEKCIKR